MVKIFSCIILNIIILYNIYSQTDNVYFNNADLYPNQVKELLGSKITSDENMQIEDFTNGWKNNLFSETEKAEIVKLSNILYNGKARDTHYFLLISMLYKLKNTTKKDDNYTIVMEYLGELMNMKKFSLNALSSFMSDILNVINNNCIHNSSTVKWEFSNSNYNFHLLNHIFSISFSNGSLTCYSKNDSIVIYETSGTFYPAESKWAGNKGLVNWNIAGFKASEVNAILNNYNIDLNRLEYYADSVVFTYQKYFNKPVLGRLNDKVMNVQNSESTLYPEFNSYNKRFFFRDLYENIDYDGGFSMKGSKIIGSGNEKEDARIIVKKNNGNLMEVKSKYFVFRPERINGINTIVKIYLNRDSIYHNDLSFIYLVKNKEVNLLKSDEFSSKSPYYNSYHKIDMDFEQLTWKIDQPVINLTMARGSAIGKARFESQNYFKQVQFESLQSMDAVHPLVLIYKFSKKIKSEQFSALSFADFVGREPNEVRQELMVMAQKGFIYYNSQKDIVTLKKRLHDYLLASTSSIDYDVVDFVSTTQAPQPNAVLDMNTFDLYINGINKIALSDSQNVTIYPTRQQIIMKENRSFQFDGKVEAGLFTFYGSNFFFNYKDFKINLQNVDSVSFLVLTSELDNYGNPIPHKVNNVIQHLTGDVQIDKADNKSGRRHLHEYPRFESHENSYVYFQSKSIEGGVYPEESFYFEVYPFAIDSLDHLSKEGLKFNGKFQSSGILPAIEQQLKLQPDYSLGFKFNPGPGGIPVYGEKGTLFADITLNNKGLRGVGKLNYLSSVTTSKDFKFYPDSMNTQSNEFVVNEQFTNTQFPSVQAANNYIHWVINDNQMFINQGNSPFQMFNTETNLNGGLILDPKGLTGRGKMNISTAEINSRLFKYFAKSFDSDTSQFILKSTTKNGYAVITEENVKSHVDFSLQKGEFTSNDDFTKVEFPENKYISFLNYFKWNMPDKTLTMGSTTKTKKAGNNLKNYFDEKFGFQGEPEGPRYISLNPKQDTLNFVAPTAIFDYKNDIIRAKDVKLLRVADAIIYPSDGEISVAEAALMRTIYNCKIIANYNDRFHTLHSANVNVQSRQSFTGTGEYDYIDENDSSKTVFMNEIIVDSALHTIARGNILEPDSFYLSPFFRFEGKVTLNSSMPLLTFTGGVKPVIKCDKPKPNWLKFNSEIDPKDIFIPINDNPLNINNNKIFSGILSGSDSIHIYPSFLSGRRNYNDSYIHTSSGYLHYNHDSMFFEIASKEKMKYPDTTGNYLIINNSKCVEYGEGRLNLGVNLGQVKLNVYGGINYNLNTNDVLIDVVLGIDFMITDNAMQLIANQLDSIPDFKPVDAKRPVLLRYLYQNIGKSMTDTFLTKLSNGNLLSVPTEFQHTVNFTNLNLKWNSKTNSYQSTGKIGIGNILNININKMIDGYVEITRKRSGDFMDIYLKQDDKNFYYFGYTRGEMQVFSSNTNFVNIIRNLTLKQRVLNVPKNETSYTLLIATDTKMYNFLRKYKQHLNSESQKPDDQEIEQQPEQEDIEKKQQDNGK